MLRHWGLSSLQEYAQLAFQGYAEDRRERDKKFAELAPAITKAAFGGSRLAQNVCDRAVHQIVTGVEIMASYFQEDTVRVSFIGSVANSDYFRLQLQERLQLGRKKRYLLSSPVFTPAAGAVLYTMKQLGFPLRAEWLDNLKQHPRSRPE